MQIRRPFVVLLCSFVALAVAWQGTAVALKIVRNRQQARIAAAEDVVRSLDPPPGFVRTDCDAEWVTCMRADDVPKQHADDVAELLAPHATATDVRCFRGRGSMPGSCDVLADVGGTTVWAYLHARLLPDPPIRFSGTEVLFGTTEQPYNPDLFYAIMAPGVETTRR